MRRLLAVGLLFLVVQAAGAQSGDADQAILAAARALTAEDIHSLLLKAEARDGEAQVILALAYSYGSGVKENYAEAVKWFGRAADQGIPLAQFFLGLMYRDGRGVRRDLSEAVKWFGKAAEKGSAEAQFNLGVMLMQGQGIGQNLEEAANWFRKAAEQGNFEAQANLGTMYLQGVGVARDFVQGQMWWLLAAQSRDARIKEGLISLSGAMTSEQTAEAQRLAALWVRQHREESTAGARLTLVEENRAKLRNETSLGYAFSASGFPRGKSYDLWLWRV